MKKATIISISLIIVGFIFEWLYLYSDSISFKLIFWLFGLVSIVAGAIGLWVFSILPLFDKKLS